MARTIVIGCGYGEDIAFFHLRSISVAEEDKFTAAFAEFAELDAEAKNQAQTDLCIASLGEWSISPITRREQKGEKSGKIEYEHSPYYPDLSTKDSIKRFFEEMDEDAVRAVEQLTYSFRVKLQPTVVFQ